MSVHHEILKYYAGIGSRKAPVAVLNLLTKIAIKLKEANYILRSGGAFGADTAFAIGAGTRKEIYVPWNDYNNLPYLYPIPVNAFKIASSLHPVWDKLSYGVKKLHARNTMQILGPNLNHKSDFVICWTEDGVEHKEQITDKTGGTATAIALASINNIPVYNIKNKESLDRLIIFLQEL